MVKIIDEVLSKLPSNAAISEATFEAANIVIYTKSKDFFLNNNGYIREIVNDIKKRIELRPDPSITIDPEKAQKIIEKIIPPEAGIANILFDPPRSEVTIEAEKPGLAIGKAGDLLKQIRQETFWVPLIRRTPAIKSKIIENIRHVLYENTDFRKKFLDRVGHRIYDGWLRGKKNEWVRVSFLGAAREVGRSCILVQTPESRIMMDCGINVASEENAYPLLESPDFDIKELDAVIISHAHLDHSGFLPYLFKYGYDGPVYCSVDYAEPVILSEEGNIRKEKIGFIIDELIKSSKNIEYGKYNEYICASVEKDIKVPAFSQKDYKINFKKVRKVIRHKVTDSLYEIKVKTGRKVKVTGSHSIFVLKDGTVKTIKIEELRVGDHLVTPHRMPDMGMWNKLPEEIEPSPELMRILGYFTAEGHLEKRSVRLTFGLKDQPYVEDLCKCVEKVFKIKCNVSISQLTRLRVTFNSKKIRNWFANVFFNGYTKANSKHVPNLIFNVNKELKLEYLKAYMAGDGYLNIKNKTVQATSVSKTLISDLSYLCTQMGFTYTLFDRFVPTAKTKARVYSITINLSDYYNREPELTKNSCGLVPLKESNFGLNWYYHRLKNRSNITKQRLSNLLNKQYIRILENTQNDQLLVQDSLYKLANSDLSFLEVTDINLCTPSNGYVYDFSVEEDENFIGGEAPICLHNTEPTRDIMALLQLDYIGIAAKDAKKAIYSSTDIKEMVKHTIPIGFEEVTDITPDIRLTFYNAGHTIGSCQTHLHIGNGLHNLVYTADMLYETSNLLSAAQTRFPRLETLIIEATYGGKNDIYPPRREAELFLMEIIKNTIKRGGKVLLPVLGVGRAQEIQIILDTAVKTGDMDKIPVYIQGMVWDVTAIHTAYPDFFNAKVKKNIFHKDQNPFLSEIFKRVAGQKEMMEVIDYEGPCIIMATSGMLTGGPSVEYLKHLANDPRNSLVLNSYQGEGSLGRKLQNGDRQLYFQNGERQEMVEVKMEIFSIHSFTGHSNRQQLQNFIYKLQPKPKRIITQHGESSKCLELASDMHKMAKIETSAPRNLEALRIR
ncbi:MAG TPA: MBL fold metallo-hydrolase [Candidatus Nanoarchaeia archaeon]|nr:MBL fold metallo-hydrolase [Candidatus Nanoarchaeia archaeon]